MDWICKQLAGQGELWIFSCIEGGSFLLNALSHGVIFDDVAEFRVIIQMLLVPLSQIFLLQFILWNCASFCVVCTISCFYHYFHGLLVQGYFLAKYRWHGSLMVPRMKVESAALSVSWAANIRERKAYLCLIQYVYGQTKFHIHIFYRNFSLQLDLIQFIHNLQML